MKTRILLERKQILPTMMTINAAEDLKTVLTVFFRQTYGRHKSSIMINNKFKVFTGDFKADPKFTLRRRCSAPRDPELNFFNGEETKCALDGCAPWGNQRKYFSIALINLVKRMRRGRHACDLFCL